VNETAPFDDIAAALDNPQDAPIMAGAGDPGPDFARGKGEKAPFPPGCPVQPLGISSNLDGSQKCYYLDKLGQIVGLESGNRHGKNAMIALFGEDSWWLEHAFPKWSEPKYEGRGAARVMVQESQVIGFDQAEASEALIIECTRRGIFDPAGRLRGRGAHALPGGGLVLHLGDTLAALRPRADGKLRKLEYHDTGLHERFVYPAASPIPRPAAQSVLPRAAIALLGLLGTWNWKRPLLDRRLLLGAIGLGFVAGAVPWRSHVWITGGKGTGKSTLNGEQGLVPMLFGDALFRSGNTSAAAIRQTLKNSTVPVMIDELEPGADNRKVTEVIELARVASSGDKIHRGGQDHQAHEFTLRSSFWFSSINVPPLEASDRSRLALLELKPFPEGAAPPDFSRHDFAQYGRELQRRMIDAWPWLARAKAAYHGALAARRYDSRACDQFATLLACAHALLEDDAPDAADVDELLGDVMPARLAEVSEAASDEETCINTLLTAHVQPRGRDTRDALSELIGRVVAKARAPGDGFEEDGADYIEQIGLKVVQPRWIPAADGKPGRWGCERYAPTRSRDDGAGEAPAYLAVAATTHMELGKIYAGTKWQGGVWKQTLARIEGAREVAAVKMARKPTRSVLVPMWAVLDESELGAASQMAAALAWVSAQEKGPGA
jgi:hypothetical protein